MYAYKYSSSGPYIIDLPVIELTSQVKQENGKLTLDWTAPTDGNYRLFFFWQQGTAQSSSAPL